MAVELQIVNFPALSQGWSGYVTAKLANTGTENVRNVKVKVVDTLVFDVLKICSAFWTGAYWNCVNCGTGYPEFSSDCLNIYSGYLCNRDSLDRNFPAGATHSLGFYTLTVKADAPVQVNTLSTFFQFEVY